MGLPCLREAAHRLELARAVFADKGREQPTRADRAELVRVADEDQLAAHLCGVGDEALQVVGARHRRLVEDDHVPMTEAATPVLHIEEEAGQGVGTKSRFVGQHACRDRRWREPDRTVAGGVPGLACRAEGAGLPRARRTDEEGHLLAATEQLAHGPLLIGAEHRARRAPCPACARGRGRLGRVVPSPPRRGRVPRCDSVASVV